MTNRQRAEKIIKEFTEPQPPSLYPKIEQWTVPNEMSRILEELINRIDLELLEAEHRGYMTCLEEMY